MVAAPTIFTPQLEPGRDWYTTAETAAYIHVSPYTLIGWVKRDRISGEQFRKFAKDYRFRRDFLENPRLRAVRPVARGTDE